MKEINYNEFDTCTIYAKKEKIEQIKACYQNFNWELFSEADNEAYADTVDLTFIRPHKTAKKDELQLLQVYMEDHLNKLGSVEKKKHQKSTIIGLCFGLLSAVLLFLGLHFINTKTSINLIIGGSLVALGFIFGTIITMIVCKVFKQEQAKFKLDTERINTELAEICSTAKNIAEGKTNDRQNNK